MEFLSREAILDNEDSVTEVVQVPEWGGAIRVRALAGDQVDAYQAARTSYKGETPEFNTKQARAQLVYYAAVDEKGHRLFISKTDVEKLGKKNNNALRRVADVVIRISGMGKEAADLAGEDSGAAPSASSTSD